MNRIADETQRIDRLTPLSEATAWIDRTASPVPPRRIPLVNAVRRVLAEPVLAADPSPDRDLAWRDGWAVRSDETIDAGGYAPAVLSGLPIRLDTGDALPDGYDAVAPIDAVDPRQQTALAVVVPGEGVLASGTDARPGETLKPAGAQLRLADLAVLSALGVTEVTVREPCLGIVTSHRDAIVDAIAAFLADVVAAAGGITASLDAIAACRGADVDAVIVIGGTGSGRDDASVRQVGRIGRIDMHGIGLTPGETAALGVIGDRPVLLVPARVDAALAVWLTLGRRIMARLGAGPVDEPAAAAIAKSKISSSLGFAELVLLRRDPDGVVPLATGHLPLAALAAADAFALIPPESEGFPAGATLAVKAMP